MQSAIFHFLISLLSSPAAYPHLTSNQQDDVQSDLTSILQSAFSASEAQPSPSSTRKDASFLELLAKDLTILPGRKAWLLNLDAVVLSDAGNIHDVLFMACRAALWDTRIPRTRAVEYRSGETGVETQDQDTEMSDIWKAAIRTKKATRAADFELEDYWDQGARLSGRSKCPVAITLNIVSYTSLCTSLHESDMQTATVYAYSRHNSIRGAGCSPEAPVSLLVHQRKHTLIHRDAPFGTRKYTDGLSEGSA